MKLSIITINYNNNAGLKKTIQSVLSQTYQDIEYIIIDGGSNDGSVDTIKQNEQKLTYWVSEKDKGIYNAMNKGIKVASGEYVLMLNSGDVLTGDEVLEKIFTKGVQADIVYADVIWNDKGKLTKERHTDKLTFQYFRHSFLCHQSVFIRTSLHHSVGLYDETMKIIADWKFQLLAVCRFNASYQHVPLFSVECEWDGLSKKPESWKIVLAERKETIEKEFPAFLADYVDFDRVQAELDMLNRKLYNRISHRINKLLKRTVISSKG